MKFLNANSIINADFIRNGLMLLVPGLISSLGIVFISSNFWTYIDKPTSLQILQIIQFQMLGLTICKFGIDQTGFALLQSHQDSKLLYKEIALYRVIPLAIIYCLCISFFAGIIPAIALSFTLCCEVYSIVVIAELNINKQFSKVSLIMINGYPLFFILVLFSSIIFQLNIAGICLILVLGSLAKTFVATKVRVAGDKYVSPVLDPKVIIQQSLNYLLFRADQILIFSILFAQSWLFQSSLSLNSLVYVTKYPELISGVLTAIWVLYLPQLTNDFVSSFVNFIKKNIIFLGLLVTGITIVGIAHFKFGKHSFENPGLLYFCFFLNALFGLPVNIITFHFLKHQNLSAIIRFAVISLFAGAVIFGLSVLFKNIWIFIWIVPIQLFIYVLLFFAWKKRSQ